MHDIAFKSASDLGADIRAKRISSLELLDHFWSRVERFNPQINAIVANDMERARARARDADAALKRGEVWGPLHGVPMTIKESVDVVGMPTTWGLEAFKDNYPTANAVVADRYLDAGAIIFAKTNVPVLLADWQTFNPIYGTTNNPWNLALSPGGSSGGSSAALAVGMTALENGSDIGASIRNPAHYCGVYGHKPSYGIVPLRGQLFPGHVAPVDFFVAGPMARSAADLATALGIIAGPDVLDSNGWTLTLPPARPRRLADYKIAVMTSHPNFEVDSEVEDQLKALSAFLAERGAKVSEVARPDINFVKAHEVYIALLRAATSRNQTAEAFQRNIQVARDLDPADRSYYAQMIRAYTMYHRDWLDADEERHRMRYKWVDFFKNYDLLLCPAAASAAQPHDHAGERYQRSITVNGRRVPTTDQMFWAGISTLFDLPATAAPIGLTPAGLPVGVQIVGKAYDDLTCIAFAGLLEQEYFGFQPPPGFPD
jgi:amidase